MMTDFVSNGNSRAVYLLRLMGSAVWRADGGGGRVRGPSHLITRNEKENHVTELLFVFRQTSPHSVSQTLTICAGQNL